MAHHKKIILFLFFWLSITFAIALSFFFWAQSGRSYVTAVKKIKGRLTTFVYGTERTIPTYKISISDNILLQKYTGSTSRKRNGDFAESDSLLLNDSLMMGLIDDSLGIQDSLYYADFSYENGGDDKSLFQQSYGDDGIVVMRDRLLFSKNFEAHVAEQRTNEALNLDSLLIGGKIPKESFQYSVEFWESPLNYKGYKRTRNRIVLYGIKDADLVSFTILENTLYMKYINDYYVLENNPVFQHLYPLRNQQLISKLRSL